MDTCAYRALADRREPAHQVVVLRLRELPKLSFTDDLDFERVILSFLRV
jgi:hypothetical protein